MPSAQRMLSNSPPQLQGAAVILSVTPGQRRSAPGITRSNRSKLPPPPWKGRFASCTPRAPSIESSRPNPSRCISSILSSVKSVPFVVTERRNGRPSARISRASGRSSPSQRSIGSPPKKLMAGAVPARRALPARKRAASLAVARSMSSFFCFTKQ